MSDCKMQEQKISSFTSTVERTCPELFWAFGMLPVGVVMCGWAVEHDNFTFLDLSMAVQW